ncbi:hypothetical protein WMY93_012048 [Mugilogobius chulae]|uniref:Uncharacterized protein n=1 Tax=Mugilogobius chulae TaxID=88201 RepID=A0AAW0P3V0_9GOBI
MYFAPWCGSRSTRHIVNIMDEFKIDLKTNRWQALHQKRSIFTFKKEPEHSFQPTPNTVEEPLDLIRLSLDERIYVKMGERPRAARTAACTCLCSLSVCVSVCLSLCVSALCLFVSLSLSFTRSRSSLHGANQTPDAAGAVLLLCSLLALIISSQRISSAAVCADGTKKRGLLY